MSRRFGLLTLLAFVCLGGQCTTPQKTILEPRIWTQTQGDEQGTGFNAVHTTYALPPLRKWVANVGDMAYSSPVMGHSGTVWVGTVTGELVGIAPDGTEQTRVYGGGSIISTPAVDDDGRVFFLGQYVTENTFRTILQEYDPAIGQFAAIINPPPMKTGASPKIWKDYVFVPSGFKLHVFNRWSVEPIAEAQGCPTVVCGSFDPSFVETAIICLGTLFTADLLGLVDCHGFSGAAVDMPTVQPSVAIVDNISFLEDPNHPIVVMATEQCLSAFDFTPEAANPQARLKYRWQHEIVPVDCDHATIRLTTPAVLDGSQVVIGDDKNFVRSYDISDGTFLWKTNVGEPVQAPPVAALRQIYVVTKNHLVVLDSDGDILSKTPLQGIGGGAALSLDFVYVMTTEGIHSFGLDPTNAQSFDGTILDGTHFGYTTPAIGIDGTVYLSTPNGPLVAFGNQPLTSGFVVPRVSWVEPIDGVMIHYPAGRSLRAALKSGGTFTGDVAISSNVDGILCNFHVDNLREGSCLTTKPLTLGPHVFTVFATDASGGQRTAQINVEVINTPPAVTITAPLDGASLYPNVSLAAQVTDAEESEIPAAKITWKSDIDGDLGTGASLDVTLTLGTHVLSCTATDEKGETTTTSITVTIVSIVG